MRWLFALLVCRSLSVQEKWQGPSDTVLRGMVNIPALAGGITVSNDESEKGCVFTFCLQYLVMPVPDPGLWTKCNVLLLFNGSGTFEYSQRLATGFYHGAMVGVGKCLMSVLITGKECPPGLFYIGGLCQKAVPGVPGPDTLIGSGEAITFDVGALNDPFPYAVVVAIDFVAPPDGALYLLGRERDVPQQDDQGLWLFDWNVSSTNTTIQMQVELPRSSSQASEISRFLFALVNPSPSNVTITGSKVVSLVCPVRPDSDQPVGVHCNGLQPDLARRLLPYHNEILMNSGWWYGIFQVNDQFIIGLMNLTSEKRVPDLYLRYGNIPTADVYDMVVAPPNDSAPVFYATNFTAKGTWFVGVYTPPEAKFSPQYYRGLWFGSDCPVDDGGQSCSGRGRCVDHICQCNFGFGYLCASSLPIVPTNAPTPEPSPHYLWLAVVIGVVVLAGACFALFRHRRAESRKRHRDYLTMPRGGSQDAPVKRSYNSMTVGAL